jgi:F-type H+-transporting ATPase subunit a
MSLVSPIFAEGLSMQPDTVFTVPCVNFSVTSSMIVALIAAIVVIGVAQTAMRAPKLIPTGLQNFVEWVVECLSNLLEGILGRDVMQRGFWFFASIFVFILGCNIISLFPGVGTYGAGHGSGWDFEVDHPFLRGANADVNMTAAMAGIFFVLWFYWSFASLGPVKFISHLFGSKVTLSNPFANFTFHIIFFLVGITEVVSIVVIRPLAFTFRLYGNIYGGEYLLDSVYKMAPHFAWALLIPFYFFELLVAFIQAFVFCILTAVFTGVMCSNDEHSPSEEEAAAH